MEPDGEATPDEAAAREANAREANASEAAARSASRRLATMISVRFSPEEARMVRAAAAEAGESVSNFIRAAALRQAGASNPVAVPDWYPAAPATWTRGGPSMSVANDGSFIAGDPRLTA